MKIWRKKGQALSIAISRQTKMNKKMKTMKIWRIAFAMLAALSLASCSSDPEWNNMVWHADVPVQITDDVYTVSHTGGEFTFSCRNYSGLWFSDAVEDGEQFYPPYINNPEYPTLQGKHFAAEIHGNKLTISFKPNTDSSVRNTSITVTAGDIFYTFNFKQFAL